MTIPSLGITQNFIDEIDQVLDLWLVSDSPHSTTIVVLTTLLVVDM
jgi:hypothetical protein